MKQFSLKAAVIALGTAFAAPATAECMYTYEDGVLVHSSENKRQLLGDPIIVTRDIVSEDLANEVGLALNFECFYTRYDGVDEPYVPERSLWPEHFPRNLDVLPSVDRLTDQYEIRLFLEETPQGPLMSADVTCGVIELTFQPLRFLDQDVPYSQAVRSLQETMLNILGQISQRPANNVTGYYQVQEHLGDASFTPPQSPLQCTAAVS